MFITPGTLQDTEDYDVKPLIDMCRMGRITEHDDIVVLCIFQKPERVVGTMAIYDEKSSAPPCFGLGLYIPVFKPRHANLTRCVALLLVARSTGQISTQWQS